ncbi:MAG: Sec-independent protein translocase protein TatB [Sideroxydans sp.]|nr:Sec-independent protein translocase protein TatB [Sideroxydans sp.]
MFEVNFSEILVIMVVALVVIGPERLPQVARTLGRMWGKLQRYVNQIKQEVNSSMEVEELRAMERKIKAEADALERSMQQVDTDINREVRQMEHAPDKPQPEAAPSVATPVNPPLPPAQP